ncbi:putative Double Clp-N motif-containing P-loop nucleoside triphosphate hydrolases superfamily protein [Hibiscus syriacus]|uniref:Double Clp-N motif-containing P-loop nucleoside triphosphate hydrolases superfamily protein n=1 Tax=Hibiscus syriacus TaxID=106335 RepID=A0A6A2ZIV1_HIBSY|nr:putative Double Clp-N motif-containing P-loop nucleoside triphosphate hydrolases superfamily protein [Hibiscus syriacus]
MISLASNVPLKKRIVISMSRVCGTEGELDVVKYIIKSSRVDVNQDRGSDGAIALHCAVVGGSFYSTEVVIILLDASADIESLDANGNRPVDLIAPACNSTFWLKKKMLESLLKGCGNVGKIEGLPAKIEGCNSMTQVMKDGTEKKEYAIDLTLPDIKSEIYGTDEFRMYNFKVTPCSRAYSHDWTECPFAHPGEYARRRDPRKYLYSCVPCPEIRKGSCKQGDNCEMKVAAIGRSVSHKPEELRPVYASTDSAIPSPKSNPHGLGSPSILLPPTLTPPLTPPGTSSSITGMMWHQRYDNVPDSDGGILYGT